MSFKEDLFTDEYIDVFEMFGGFQKALIESVHEAT